MRVTQQRLNWYKVSRLGLQVAMLPASACGNVIIFFFPWSMLKPRVSYTPRLRRGWQETWSADAASLEQTICIIIR